MKRITLLGVVGLLLLTGMGEGVAQDLPTSQDVSPAQEERLWQTLTPVAGALEGRIQIFFLDGGEARARRALQVLEAHPNLPGIPDGIPAGVELYFVPDEGIWEELALGGVPHWGAAVAIPSLNRIVIPMFRHPWQGGIAEDRTLRHEWAHLGLHQMLGGMRIPRWFDEGYAQWSAGSLDWTDGWKLRIGLLRRSDEGPLEGLDLVWPEARSEAELAYLLSASAVTFMVGESGSRGMTRFLSVWEASGSMEQAMRTTFGMTLGQFEDRWVDHVKRRYGGLVLLTQTGMIWGILGVIVFVLFWIRRRRNRLRLEGMRTQDPDSGGSWWQPYA